MAKYDKSEPHTIQNMFNSIANRYDLTNSVLSLKMHKSWNSELVKRTCFSANSKQILDLCSGTGDIACEFFKQNSEPCEIYLVDFSCEMLNRAKEKIRSLHLHDHQKVHFIESDVQQLPLGNESMDCATMAYGIRNVKNPAKCLQEIHRILRPGSHFGILELTQPKNPFLRMGHRFYLQTFVPLMGKFITSNQGAYEYLKNSIRTFISPSEMKQMLVTAGFERIECTELAGGIATILIAFRP